MRLFALILLTLAFLALLKRICSPRVGKVRQTPADAPPEKMVRCAGCGVHLPISESIEEKGRYYCCERHRISDA